MKYTVPSFIDYRLARHRIMSIDWGTFIADQIVSFM